MSRLLAIGDVHGCATALGTLLDFVSIKPTDTVVTLGDYVDRGPNSKGVLDLLISRHREGNFICLRGNHEMMMLGARQSSSDFRFWCQVGGDEALESYRTGDTDPTLASIPHPHWHFIEKTCVDWHESEKHLFVHAGVHPGLPMDEQISMFLHWEFTNPNTFAPHFSGKTMLYGHCEQRSGKPLVHPGAIGIDTYAYGGGWLTCLDVDTGKYWQSNDLGQTRNGCL